MSKYGYMRWLVRLRPATAIRLVTCLPSGAATAEVRLGRVVAAAAAAATLAAVWPRLVHCDEEEVTVAGPWRHRLGDGAKLLDTRSRISSLQKRNDKQFIWQTCSVPGGIEDCNVFICAKGDEGVASSLGELTVVGKTRICAALRVGDVLNGHVGLLHGGFTSALLDDFTGLAAWLEKEAHGLGKTANIFTANLNVNYRRPLPCNSEYLIEVTVERVEKSKKVFLNAVVYDQQDRPCVEATALYIIKQ